MRTRIRGRAPKLSLKWKANLYALSMAEQSQGQLPLGWAGLQPSATLLMMSCWHLLLKHMFGLSRPFPPPSGLPHASLLILSFKGCPETNLTVQMCQRAPWKCLQQRGEAVSGKRDHSLRASGLGVQSLGEG